MSHSGVMDSVKFINCGFEGKATAVPGPDFPLIKYWKYFGFTNSVIAPGEVYLKSSREAETYISDSLSCRKNPESLNYYKKSTEQ